MCPYIDIYSLEKCVSIYSLYIDIYIVWSSVCPYIVFVCPGII